VTQQILALFGGERSAATVFWIGSALVSGVVYQVTLLAVLGTALKVVVYWYRCRCGGKCWCGRRISA
jgi:hypothetical protein